MTPWFFNSSQPKSIGCDSFTKTESRTYTGIGRGGGVVE
ncbi:hypothetical protein RintRC_7472 [Richelia intracellularis]|nr:hypothetical protein RintRC_7472 [Richelia intracellularis]